MFGPIGVWEMVIILVIALIVFGPRKLPELGRSLGKSLGEFKRASNELRNTLDEEIRIEERRTPKAPPAKSAPPSAPAPGAAQDAPEPDASGSSAPAASPEPATVAAPTPEPHPTEPGAGA
ncbi:MAG: twin-arginine translocase subunit TatB [Acidobacteria bacterium]|nr:twin-arginine translocase subunit TatB [Acidobacteriota bacterium]